MTWMKKLFGKTENNSASAEPMTTDMRTTPIDNPFDYREDGSIHEGDPAWDMMMSAMNSDKAVIGNQRADGTWDVKGLD